MGKENHVDGLKTEKIELKKNKSAPPEIRKRKPLRNNVERTVV